MTDNEIGLDLMMMIMMTIIKHSSTRQVPDFLRLYPPY